MFSLYIGTLIAYHLYLLVSIVYGRFFGTEEVFLKGLDELSGLMKMFPSDIINELTTLVAGLRVIGTLMVAAVLVFFFPLYSFILWMMLNIFCSYKYHQSMMKIFTYASGETEEINFEEVRPSWIQVINLSVITGGLVYALTKVVG